MLMRLKFEISSTIVHVHLVEGFLGLEFVCARSVHAKLLISRATQIVALV